MPATPQEGGGTDPRSLTDLHLESFAFDVSEWTDGQVTVHLTLTTKQARYRVPMSLSEFLLLDIEAMKVTAELLKQRKVGR